MCTVLIWQITLKAGNSEFCAGISLIKNNIINWHGFSLHFALSQKEYDRKKLEKRKKSRFVQCFLEKTRASFPI